LSKSKKAARTGTMLRLIVAQRDYKD
jgi:hypothetical protein